METRKFDPVAISEKSTVVAEYVPDAHRDDDYQSEAQLEREFIRQLQAQAYDYVDIHDESQLESNLRTQLELLNGVVFSDKEWKDFFTSKIAGANDTLAGSGTLATV